VPMYGDWIDCGITWRRLRLIASRAPGDRGDSIGLQASTGVALPRRRLFRFVDYLELFKECEHRG
jgi:hypothetical protein